MLAVCTMLLCWEVQLLHIVWLLVTPSTCGLAIPCPGLAEPEVLLAAVTQSDSIGGYLDRFIGNGSLPGQV